MARPWSVCIRNLKSIWSEVGPDGLSFRQQRQTLGILAYLSDLGHMGSFLESDEANRQRYEDEWEDMIDEIIPEAATVLRMTPLDLWCKITKVVCDES